MPPHPKLPQKRLRQQVVEPLFSFLTVQLVGLLHEYWKLLNHPDYREAWTPAELALMRRKHEELTQMQKLFSDMSHRLRHGKNPANPQSQ